MLCGGLEHLKIKTRLIDEKFASVMGECVFVKLYVLRLYLELYATIPPLTRMLTYFDLRIKENTARR